MCRYLICRLTDTQPHIFVVSTNGENFGDPQLASMDGEEFSNWCPLMVEKDSPRGGGGCGGAVKFFITQ